MNTLMTAQMGLSLAGAFGSYASASIQADLQGKINSYRDTMNRLSAARQTNAVEVNRARVQDAGTQADLMIQRQAMQDQGQAEVQAAAAGVAGNSVKMVMHDLRASASRASYAQKRQKYQQLAELDNQKTSIAINSIVGQSNQVVPKPNIGSTLLGLGTNLLTIYDSHQPDS